MEGLTPDLIEQILLEEEANIARSRARQMVALRAANMMQLPPPTPARFESWRSSA